MQASQYQPGQQLPGTVYRVVRHLATGGMGSVYDVEDVTVGKRYVLKTLHPQLIARHDLAKRMEAEARTLAKLQHPNIVDVVTAGITTDEQKMPFYVMERLNGQNLRVVLEKKSSLELAHCYRIAIDVLDALEHAHENAVIHRDVKPENIFLHRNANGTTITKLLDFGIMRLLDRKASHTQGKFIGTLRYASPEQITGGELGPATDIYSIGIVLYEMIAGRGPFDDAGDAYAIGAAHVQKAAPALSRFARVPPVVEQLVMSTLAKNPAERPRDCFTIASELRRLRRDDEAAPRSATAVNVLSMAPATRADTPPVLHGGSDPQAFAGTEASPGGADGRQVVRPASAGVTSSGMGDTVLDPTGGVRGSRPGSFPPTPQTSPLAATLASASAPPPNDPMQGRSPSIPGVAPLQRGIDRNAPTRASTPFGSTQRLAQNGTMMDDGFAAMPEEAVRDALDERISLEVPSANGTGPSTGDIVFPPMRASSTTGSGTGPLAGEAATRPPTRRSVVPLLVAAIAGAALVAGGFVVVTKTLRNKGASFSAASEAASTLPSAAPRASEARRIDDARAAPSVASATVLASSNVVPPSVAAPIAPVVGATPTAGVAAHAAPSTPRAPGVGGSGRSAPAALGISSGPSAAMTAAVTPAVAAAPAPSPVAAKVDVPPPAPPPAPKKPAAKPAAVDDPSAVGF